MKSLNPFLCGGAAALAIGLVFHCVAIATPGMRVDTPLEGLDVFVCDKQYNICFQNQ